MYTHTKVAELVTSAAVAAAYCCI